MIKQGGEWKAVDWQTALDFVAQRPQATIVARHGGARSARWCRRTRRSRSWRWRRASCAASARTTSTSGCGRRDFRGDGHGARHSVARHAGRRARRRSIACSSSAASCARTIRLLAQRLRQAARKGRAGVDAAFGRRRLADPGRAQGDRRAVADCRRCSPTSSAAAAGRAASRFRQALAGIEPDGRRRK